MIRITANYSMVDFHDDLKDAMMTAASSSNDDPSNSDSNVVPGTPTIFLLSDTQIQNETMVENISNLLNSGEVPNMMGQEDMANAVESIRQSAKSDRTYMKALEQPQFSERRARVLLTTTLSIHHFIISTTRFYFNSFLV